MKAKRENLADLAEIANFKQIFKNKGKAPKVLKKSDSYYERSS